MATQKQMRTTSMVSKFEEAESRCEDCQAPSALRKSPRQNPHRRKQQCNEEALHPKSGVEKKVHEQPRQRRSKSKQAKCRKGKEKRMNRRTQTESAHAKSTPPEGVTRGCHAFDALDLAFLRTVPSDELKMLEATGGESLKCR